MPMTARIAGCLCGLLLSGLPAIASAHHSSHKASSLKAPAQPAQPVVQPAPPEPPPTPEHMPATPPQVTMSGGQLSIVAENSTLGDVLSAVRNLTGAGLEVPNAANSERVVVHLGPGNPQDVLQDLFSGSKFNYIILGSPDNSAAIQKIILTARVGGKLGPGPGNPNNAGNDEVIVNNPYHSQPPPPDLQTDSGVDDEIVQPEPPQPEEVTPPAQGQGQGPNSVIPLEQMGPKTPEQLLQELQRMQQQQNQSNDPARPPRGTVQQQ